LHFQTQLATIYEIVRSHADFNCGERCRLHDALILSGGGGMSGIHRIERQFTYCITTVDGRFYIVGAAQTFPLRMAMRQLSPVYVMAALLLATLFIPRNKQTPKENLDA